jgi:hypothetical protein
MISSINPFEQLFLNLHTIMNHVYMDAVKKISCVYVRVVIVQRILCVFSQKISYLFPTPSSKK